MMNRGQVSDAILSSPLTGTQKLILLGYLRHQDDRGISWPAAARLAEYAGTAVNTVREHRQALIGWGVLVVVEAPIGLDMKCRINLGMLPSPEDVRAWEETLTHERKVQRREAAARRGKGDTPPTVAPLQQSDPSDGRTPPPRPSEGTPPTVAPEHSPGTLSRNTLQGGSARGEGRTAPAAPAAPPRKQGEERSSGESGEVRALPRRTSTAAAMVLAAWEAAYIEARPAFPGAAGGDGAAAARLAARLASDGENLAQPAIAAAVQRLLVVYLQAHAAGGFPADVEHPTLGNAWSWLQRRAPRGGLLGLLPAPEAVEEDTPPPPLLLPGAEASAADVERWPAVVDALLRSDPGQASGYQRWIEPLRPCLEGGVLWLEAPSESFFPVLGAHLEHPQAPLRWLQREAGVALGVRLRLRPGYVRVRGTG